MDELIEEFRRKKTDEQYYQWLYNKAEAIQLWQNKNFHLYYLGFGFNLVNGIPNMGLLAMLDDESDTQALKGSIITNWEIAEPSPADDYKPTIWSVDHKSQLLEKMFVKKQLPPNLAFFLSRALKYLA